MTRCVHDMEPGTCSWCTGRDGGEAALKAHDADLIARHRAFRSDYPGTCGGCGERFAAGAAISSRGRGRFRAACCLDDNGAPTR